MSAEKSMKIVVRKKLPIFVSLVVASIQRAAVVLVVTVLGVALLLASTQLLPIEHVQPASFAIGILVLLVYWASKMIDASLQVKGSYLEITDSQVSGMSAGFSSNSFTVPIQKIATMYIHQDFIDKLFGISAIVFTQMNSSVSVYGFEYSQAQAFVKKFSELQSKK